jgi:hypothetical protein
MIRNGASITTHSFRITAVGGLGANRAAVSPPALHLVNGRADVNASPCVPPPMKWKCWFSSNSRGTKDRQRAKHHHLATATVICLARSP